jgi:hypothetical protein
MLDTFAAGGKGLDGTPARWRLQVSVKQEQRRAVRLMFWTQVALCKLSCLGGQPAWTCVIPGTLLSHNLERQLIFIFIVAQHEVQEPANQEPAPRFSALCYVSCSKFYCSLLHTD